MKYSCLVWLLLLLTASCSKSERLKAKHTSKLNKSYAWEVMVYTSSYALEDSTYYYPDTAIAITVTDDETL